MNFFQINLLVVLLIVLVVLLIISVRISTDDARRKFLFRKKAMKKVPTEYDGEFEAIYDGIMNGKIEEVRQEKNKWIKSCVRNITMAVIVTILFICSLFLIGTSEFLGVIFAVFWQIVFFAVIVLCCENSFNKSKEYKKKFIERLISGINPNIEYGNEDISRRIVATFEDAGFRDNVIHNKRNVTDNMSYTTDNGRKVEMTDLNLSYLHMGMSKDDSSYTVEVFQGIVAVLSEEWDYGTNEILIERNKLFKSEDRIVGGSEKFEKIFNLCAKRDVSNFITDDIKAKLVELYYKYELMFEISIKESKIYIRFFTGPMFERNCLGPLVNKRKMYVEYFMFRGVLDIINQISQIL